MKLASKYVPLAATVTLFLAMSAYGSLSYTGFFSAQAFLNLLIDNAFLVIVAVGLELDAIAAVVIGGTLLSGGVGYVFGTLFGVLTLGIIQSLIMFDGSLSSWWTRIVIGALLFVFCVLQRVFETGRKAG